MYDSQPIYNHDIPFQNVPEGTSTKGYVEKLILFLETYLPSFVDERKVNPTLSENDITELLYKHLSRKRKFNSEGIEYPFEFQPEKSQKKKGVGGHPKRMDIASRLNTLDVDMEVIYCIEAKKLPTPGTGREKEYIIGDGGAIERFKNEVHGMDDFGNLLENNGVIAYIAENDFDYWHAEINGWMILEDAWNSSEHLEKIYFDKIGKLKSTHTRKSGAPLYLTHFWVCF